MIDFTEDNAFDAIKFAIGQFNEYDRQDLIDFKFGERVITHRLAAYLRDWFEEKYATEKIRVDCEYNRRGKDNPKQAFGPTINAELKELLFAARDLVEDSNLYPEAFKDEARRLLSKHGQFIDPEELQEFVVAVNQWDEIAGSLLNPDIVVHTRGNCVNNLLVIEAKKGYPTHQAVAYDLMKLRYFVSELKYKGNTDEPDVESGLGYRYGFFLHFRNNGTLRDAIFFEPENEDLALNRLA